MHEQSDFDPKKEGIALSRRCTTAAKGGDFEALFAQVTEFEDDPEVLCYAILHMSAFVGDMLSSLLSDGEWEEFLMKERKDDN